MKKMLYVTNIPAPYRQKRYNLMAEIFPLYDIDVEVMYMAEIEKNREWIISKESYKYHYKIYKGIHPTVGNMFAHFNPGLLFKLWKGNYDIVIIGGMSSPTHLLAPFLVPKSKIQVMSVESNMYSVNRKKGVGAWLKKIILKKANAYQVTGNPQIEYIKYFCKTIGDKKIVKLPNLIDENVYRDDIGKLKNNTNQLSIELNIDKNSQIWILPARLIDKKGIIPFLSLLKGIDGYHLYILGDGPLKNTISDFVNENNLNVTLVGYLQQDEIIKYYAVADIFVLPSLRDPSPLSPIEACAAGLPLLVSSRIGNLEDVLSNGNGWSYDPVTEKNKGIDIINKVLKLTNQDLKNIKEKSLANYNNNFDSRKCITSYAENLKALL